MDQESSDQSGIPDGTVPWTPAELFFLGHGGSHRRRDAALKGCGTGWLAPDRRQSVIENAGWYRDVQGMSLTEKGSVPFSSLPDNCFRLRVLCYEM